MSDTLDKFLDSAPKAARPTIKWLLAIIAAGVLGIWSRDAADAHIMRKTRPLRIRVEETSGILVHVFNDFEEERRRRGEEVHSLDKVREDAHKRALATEHEDDADPQ